ncbi:MAG TPA: DUF423 domain-containing protein [Flavobacteriaceae bacterium]|nr:DUF423 domain-containing protein [Flavobacteriaceae bacterium]
MNKNIVVTATSLAGLAVILGAFGAHGLKKVATPEQVLSFDTAVRYQMYHALALLVIGLSGKLPDSLKKLVCRLFYWGVLLFSGSIYLFTFKDQLGFEVGKLGLITPVGGILLMTGWLVLVYKIVNLKNFKN